MYDDIELRNIYEAIEDEYGVDSKCVKRFIECIAVMSRDRARFPMTWKKELNDGLSSTDVKPWFFVNESYKDGVNVEDDSEDPSSNFWKKVLDFRRHRSDVAVYGYDFEHINFDNDKLFSFTKRYGNNNIRRSEPNIAVAVIKDFMALHYRSS